MRPSGSSSTSSAQVEGQSCGQTEWPISTLAWTFIAGLPGFAICPRLAEFVARAKGADPARLAACAPIGENPAMDLRIETELEDDGRWIAEVPQLPGVLAYGATAEEAAAKAEALALRVLAEGVRPLARTRRKNRSR